MHRIQLEEGAVLAMERLPDPLPELSLHLVTYASCGLQVKGYLAVPQAAARCLPLVYCRGGIGRVGMVRIPHVVSFAIRGYAVFAPFYRGSSSGAGRDEFGGEDRYDVFNAIKLMRRLTGVERVPIPVVGFSRGAIMAMLAAKECAGIGPVIVWGGVSDLQLTYGERVDLRRMLRRVVGHPQKDAAAYRERSAVCWAEDVRVPIMVVHGTADENVSAEHARRLGRALDAAGKPYAMSLYEGLGHSFPAPVMDNAMREMDQWLRRQLSLFPPP